jgi:hypothetical protein
MCLKNKTRTKRKKEFQGKCYPETPSKNIWTPAENIYQISHKHMLVLGGCDPRCPFNA